MHYAGAQIKGNTLHVARITGGGACPFNITDKVIIIFVRYDRY